jgi:hypothetical protein
VARNSERTRRAYEAFNGPAPWSCTYCGDPVEGVGHGVGHIHHIDEDPDNDTKDNLEAMHPVCHKRHHRQGKPGNRKGATVTPEVRARISAALKGRPAAHGYTPEVIEKMAAARRGKPHVEAQLTCECGKQCHAGPMKRHQSASGHALAG